MDSVAGVVVDAAVLDDNIDTVLETDGVAVIVDHLDVSHGDPLRLLQEHAGGAAAGQPILLLRMVALQG
jgi:hypothetical protein